MANEFKIKKGLIVDGTGTVLQVKAANVPVLTINDSYTGSLFAVNNSNGFAVLSVSSSKIEMGSTGSTGTRPLLVSGSSAYITGSAFLLDLVVSGSVRIGDVAASGKYSFAHGQEGTWAKGDYSHAQGAATIASGSYSHAQGAETIALGYASHAEGDTTTAFGTGSHAEGYRTTAVGDYSHAEGHSTRAIGTGSHAEGYYTSASGNYQHVTGQFNATSSQASAFIHGNGVDANNRRNLIFAYGSGSNGVVEISGSLRVQGGIVGATVTTVVSSSATTGTHTISNNDNTKIILFRNSCTASLPTSLAANFECTVVSVAGKSIKFVTGSNSVILLNNTGTTLPERSSVTIKNTGTSEEYLTNGAL